MFNNLSGSFSICLRVLATSRGQVAPAEITPAINPAEKFAPNITAALLFSPTNPVKCLLVGSRTVQHIAEKGTSRASCAPRPVHRRWYPRKFSGLLMLCLDESTPSKVFHIPGGFPPTFDSLKAVGTANARLAPVPLHNLNNPSCLVTLENTSIVPLYWKHSGLQDGPKPLIPPVLHDG